MWWSDDQEWYSGVIKSFDFESNKHTILYDDNELEILDLKKEKVCIHFYYFDSI